MARLLFNDIVSPTLLERFALEAEQEGGNEQYYALILRDDGNLCAHHPFGPSLHPEQLIWAGDLLRALNRELHHDGAWVIVFTHVIPTKVAPGSAIFLPGHSEYGRYALVWIDHDGDPQFTQEWIAGENTEFRHFGHVLAAGIPSTMQKCEMSWSIWNEMMRKLIAPTEGQTFRKAKGERPVSQRN